MSELIGPIANRRARRSFAPTAVSAETREALWRAINVAPSHGNTQPTRVLVADSPAIRERLIAALSEGNKSWAPSAPLLFALVTNMEGIDAPAERELIAFNSGIAAGSLLAQATAMGVTCHPMAGFDEPAARSAFGVPGHVRVLAIVAAGYPGPIEVLPPDLQEKEAAPQYRIPLTNLVGVDHWTEEQALDARALKKRGS